MQRFSLVSIAVIVLLAAAVVTASKSESVKGPEPVAAADGQVVPKTVIAGSSSEITDSTSENVCDGDFACLAIGWLMVILIFSGSAYCCWTIYSRSPHLEKVDLSASEYRQVTELALKMPSNAEWIAKAPAENSIVYSFPRGRNEWSGWYDHSGPGSVTGSSGSSSGEGGAAAGAASQSRSTSTGSDGRVPLNMHLIFSQSNKGTKMNVLGGSLNTGPKPVGGPFTIDGLWSFTTGKVAFSKVHDPRGGPNVSGSTNCIRYLYRAYWDGTKLYGDWFHVNVESNFHESGRFELYPSDEAAQQLRGAPAFYYSSAPGPLGLAPIAKTSPAPVPAATTATGQRTTTSQPQLYPQLYHHNNTPAPGSVHAIAIAGPLAVPSTAAPAAAAAAATDRTPLLSAGGSRAPTTSSGGGAVYKSDL